MNIIQVASEAIPFAKTGGLADVAGVLPIHLAGRKHTVVLFLPFYKQVKEGKYQLDSTEHEIKFKIGDAPVQGRIWKSHIPETKIPVYFIQRDEYYHRDYLYSTPEGDYLDNAERFIFFSRATVEAVKMLGIKADIIHCHDWQTALIPVYLKTLYGSHHPGRDRNEPAFKNTKTVMTIHNLAYQGLFWHWDMKLTGLDWSLFNWKQLEFYGKLNFLKGGMVFADALTTVSPRYAQEIQTKEFGHGLEGVLVERAKNLYGILNGADYTNWSPKTDKLIPANYTPANLKGKAACKKALQKKLNLPEGNAPIIGMVTRLAGQKGLDILTAAFDELMKEDVQVVLLGTGEEKYHQIMRDLAKKYPTKTGITIAFDNQLAHLITAGADMFLMPSRYEPCGLNQLYALKYGTVPIVRATGGLADTVIDYQTIPHSELATEFIPLGNSSTPNSKLPTPNSTGFTFTDYTADTLLATIKRALTVYNQPKPWTELVRRAMSQDFSWKKSVLEYERVYQRLMDIK